MSPAFASAGAIAPPGVGCMRPKPNLANAKNLSDLKLDVSCGSGAYNESYSAAISSVVLGGCKSLAAAAKAPGSACDAVIAKAFSNPEPNGT